MRLLIFLDGAWEVENGITDFAVVGISCCRRLLQFFKDEELNKDVASLEAAKQMVETENDFSALLLDESHIEDALLKMLLSLKRKVLLYEAKQSATMDKCKGLLKAMAKQHVQAKKLRQSEEEKLLMQKENNLEFAQKALSDIAGGQRKGQDGMTTCTANSWDGLLKHADETILQGDACWQSRLTWRRFGELSPFFVLFFSIHQGSSTRRAVSTCHVWKGSLVHKHNEQFLVEHCLTKLAFISGWVGLWECPSWKRGPL